ncbi:DUF3306 domain-containing protein [Roseibium sp.]|uniref:DUF3306 domain-containing protein n=1 Tax=Roseibium sp. TaxID=1936156 RepID=UPI003A96AC96
MTRSRSDEGEEGFLARWSRRKRTGPANEDPEQSLETFPVSEDRSASDSNTSEIASEAAKPAVEAVDEEARSNREAAEAINLDELTDASDISAFLKRGVPAALKNAALSRIWRSNPVFAVLDGLNDYDEDFRTVAGVTDLYKSSWVVGKGYADKAEEIARKMEEESARLARLRAEQNEPEGGLDDEVPALETLGSANEDSTSELARVNVEASEVFGSEPTDVTTLEPASEGDDEDVDEQPAKVGLRRRMQFGQEEG